MNKAQFRAELAKNEYTQARLAKELGMSESTLIRKIKNNSLTLNEANNVASILNISNPGDIFLPNK